MDPTAVFGAVAAVAALIIKLFDAWQTSKKANQQAEQEQAKNEAYQARLKNAEMGMAGDQSSLDALSADIDRLRERYRSDLRQRQQRGGSSDGG